MNKSEIKWIINTVCDFMIDSKQIHKHDTFEIKAYSNPNEFKIPVRFGLSDLPIDHIVVDYNNKLRLEECEGVNDFGEFIRLSCDLRKLQEIGYVDYYPNDNLTNEINKELNKNGEAENQTE